MGKAKKNSTAKVAARGNKVQGNGKSAVGENGSKRSVASETVLVDRRNATDRRKSEDRRKVNVPVVVERRSLERREKVSRRRQIDPTTCERNYSPEEIEFMTALEGYKRTSGRMFPTCSEILEVLRGLGYQKQPVVEPAAAAPLAVASPSTDGQIPETLFSAV